MLPSSRASFPFLVVLAVACLLLVRWGGAVAERARGPVVRLGAGLLGCPELVCGAAAPGAGGEKSSPSAAPAPAKPYRLHVRADLPGVDADKMFRTVVSPAQKAGADIPFVLDSDSTTEAGVSRMHFTIDPATPADEASQALRNAFAAAGLGYLNLTVSEEDDDSPVAVVKEPAVVSAPAPESADEPAPAEPVVEASADEPTPAEPVAEAPADAPATEPVPAEPVVEAPVAAPSEPEPAPAEAGPSDFFVVVFLTDGSRLEGALRLESLSVESEALGRLSLPVSSLSRAEAGEDGAPWRMETHAGDELRVRPAADAKLPLSTDFGEISVPMSAVKAIEFPKG